jgi:hypothetical protein
MTAKRENASSAAPHAASCRSPRALSSKTASYRDRASATPAAGVAAVASTGDDCGFVGSGGGDDGGPGGFDAAAIGRTGCKGIAASDGALSGRGCGGAAGFGGGIGADDGTACGFAGAFAPGCSFTVGRAVCCVFATAAFDGAGADDGITPEMALVSLSIAPPNHGFGTDFGTGFCPGAFACALAACPFDDTFAAVGAFTIGFADCGGLAVAALTVATTA